MLVSLAAGLLTLCTVLVAWVTVQHAWRRVFPDPDPGADPDALAGRLGCHGLCEPKPCTRRCPDRAGATEEEPR
jgi:hypothetical protein